MMRASTAREPTTPELLQLSTEILVHIVNELERCVIDEDLTDGMWPTHSQSSCNDILNVRLVCSKLRDIAWPVFARMLGTSIFTLTPISLSSLREIACHPELSGRLETLSLSKAYLDDEPYRRVHYETNDKVTLFQLVGFGHEGRQTLQKLMTSAEGNIYKNDVAELDRAWRKAFEQQVAWSADESNPTTMLTLVFKSLKNLHRLRITDAFTRRRTTQKHKLWLRMEIGARLPPNKRHLLDRYDLATGYAGSQVFCPYFQRALEAAIMGSEREFDSIIESLGWGFEQKEEPYLQSLRRMANSNAFVNLKVFSLHIVEDDDDPIVGRILVTLFNTAPQLKQLHVNLMMSWLDSWTYGLKCDVKLELLELIDTPITKRALMSFITSHLQYLRLCEVDLYHNELGIDGDPVDMTGDEVSTVLLELAENASLKVLHLDRLAGRGGDCDGVELKYLQLDALAEMVPFLAVHQAQNGAPMADPMRMTRVFVEGTEVDDGPHCAGKHVGLPISARRGLHTPGRESKRGLWATGRFGFPLGLKANEEDVRLRGLY